MTTYNYDGTRDTPASVGAWTITSWTEDLTLAGNEAGAANVAACLATLIKQLIQKGVLKGSVAT